MTLKTCAVLSALALIPVVVLFPLGPFLFGSVFGSSFAASGELARLLAVSTGLNLIVSPISMLPSIMGRQHQHFWFAILSAVFRILSLWIGVRLGSPATTVACFVAGECAGMIIFSVWVYWLIKIPRFSSPP